MTSTTTEIELPPAIAHKPGRASSAIAPQEISTGHVDHNDPEPPTNFVRARQRWNHPKSNISRVFSTFWSFVVMGANDAAYGALIPYLEKYYSLGYTVIALVFLSPFIGYTSAAALISRIHHRFGQRGIALIGPICHTITYIILCVHPPWPVVVIVCVLAGFGNGVLDAAWNTYIGNMANANEILGFLHGFYGLGATISPLIATSMITKGHLPWYSFYYLMICLGVIELGTAAVAFWSSTGKVFRDAQQVSAGSKSGSTRQVIRNQATWLCSAFLFVYVGVEVSLGGWIVTFMINVRSGTAFASGISAVGFWLGITVGRVILGFVTPRIYLLASMGLELLFWLVPHFLVSAIAVAFLGFFLGPLFPAVVVAAMKILPQHMHISAVGFASAFGGAGAAMFPFVVGAMAQAKGVTVLQPFILAMLGLDLVLWVLISRIPRTHHQD
ncbi:MFS transporter [Xylona heveae TC161]|uniref:MFS transporter n=1 Tax=Xylona heveae (strain CBS 132557 / TC161) TaxID=1328760 RepID=A0A164ZQT5_XYLHT|nr:MFS transporter [Xylona heveae TC161]KZF19392.1 MFS transporter [Xylona heveae TC161]